MLIVELAPWMGSVANVWWNKRVLRKTLGVSCLTPSQLTTEVEVVVNSRPLVYVEDDINSNYVMLPNNFYQ